VDDLTYERSGAMDWKLEVVPISYRKESGYGESLCGVDPATMGMPPGIPPEVSHVVTFEAVDGNRTQLTVTEYGYTSDQIVEVSRAGMEQCLDKMAASFAGDIRDAGGS
jgi:hypothetical protein